MSELLPTAKDVNIKDLQTKPFFMWFDKRFPIFELHLASFKCKRMEFKENGWHTWDVPCTNVHLTTIEPENPMSLN